MKARVRIRPLLVAGLLISFLAITIGYFWSRQAIQRLERRVRKNPGDVALRCQLAHELLASGLRERAANELRGIRQRATPGTIDQITRLGEALLVRHAADEIVIAHLALVFFLGGRDEPLLPLAQQLIDIGPTERVLGHALLAHIERDRGNQQKALLHFRKAQPDLDPLRLAHPELDIRMVELGHADAAIAVGYVAEALEVVGPLWRRSATFEAAGLLYVEALRQLGRAAEAMEALDQLSREQPKSVMVIIRRAQLHMLAGDVTQALEAFADALRQSPDSSTIRDQYTRAILRQGDPMAQNLTSIPLASF